MAVRHGGSIFATASALGIPWQAILDFSASINPLGPSPKVKEAILTALDSVAHYPPIHGEPLCERLASEWAVDQDQILTGNGAADLLRDFCNHFPQGHLAAPVFSEFERLWPNAQYCRIDDVATWPARGTVVVTRPVNPTGFLIDAEAITTYLDRSETTVLVDESFIDFTGAQSLAAATRDLPRLLVLRSLTKFYALPGLRVGALVGHRDTIRSLAALRTPWSVNTLALHAALAAIDDQAHCRATQQFVDSERTWMTEALAAMRDARVWPSQANYVYVEIPYASALVRFAAERRILLRDCTGWQGCPPSGIRVAVRRRWENQRLLAVWKEYLCQGS